MIRDNIMYPTQNAQAQPYVSCMEVYEKINTNMLTAIMFHEQVTDLFDFLNLHGFKRMHEYQYLSELVERRRLKRYVLNKIFNRILRRLFRLLIEDNNCLPVFHRPQGIQFRGFPVKT